MEKKKRMAIAGVRIVIVMMAGVIALSLSASVSAQPPNDTVPPIPTIPPDIAPTPTPTVTVTPTATATPAATPTLAPTPTSTPPDAIPGFGISMVVIAVLSVFVLFTLKGKKRRG